MRQVVNQGFVVEFTPAERRVLERLVHGEVYKEIAVQLGCSRKTVEFHVYNMLRKSKLGSRLRLVALAVQQQYAGER